MKKILTIALIAALCLTSVFAVSFTGSAALNLGYNLDTKDYGFANSPSTTLKFGFELGSGSAENAGEKDLRAEIAAEFKVEFKEAKYTKDGVAVITFDSDKIVGSPVVTLEISKANILYKDILTFGILDAGKSADYAESFNVNDNGDTLSDLIVPLKDVYGFTVTANKLGVSGGFGLEGNSDKGTYFVLSHAALSSFAVTDNFEVSAALAGKFTKNESGDKSNVLQANAKAAYDNGDKISASAAVDFKLDIAEDNTVPGLEAAVAAKYDFASLDLYYYSVDKFENNILDGKVAASYTFEENYTATGSFTAYNMANKTRASEDKTNEAREFKPALEFEAVVDKFTFTVGGSYKIISKVMEIYGKVEYTTDMFSANFSANYAKTIDVEKTNQLYFTAGISSDAVIDGAKLALTYGKASSSDVLNVLDGQTPAQKLGKVNASATISF